MGSKKWFFRGEEKNFYELPEQYKKEELIYLQPYAKKVLRSIGTPHAFMHPAFSILSSILDPDKTYVIGGLVDSHYMEGLLDQDLTDRYKIRTAKLPLNLLWNQETLQTKTVLKVHQIAEILSTQLWTKNWH